MWGEGPTTERERERREEETQYLTHSHMNHFAACVYRCGMQVEEDMGLVVVVRNTSSEAAAAAAAAARFPLCTGTCIG